MCFSRGDGAQLRDDSLGNFAARRKEMGEKVEVEGLGENLVGVLQVTMGTMHFGLNALRLNPNRLFQRWEEAGAAIRL